MPQDRQGSFYLSAVVGEDLGGAAAASYVRNFLPMAVASGSTVTVPVLRPSFALGLSDIADNMQKVNRDGTAEDGKPTFFDNTEVTFGANGKITFDPNARGDITNVNDLDAKDGTFSNNLDVDGLLSAGRAEIDTLKINNLIADGLIKGDLQGSVAGNLVGVTRGTHIGQVIGDVEGSLDGNAATASRLANAKVIALGGAASGSTAFDGSSGITIPVTALNAGYLNSGTVAVGRLTGEYNIGISGKAMTAGAADTAKYASTTGLLKDTDGETAGSFTMKTSAGGNVEFGGTSPVTTVTFTGPGITDWQFGLDGHGILRGQSTSAAKLHTTRTIALINGATGSPTAFDGTNNIEIPITAINATYLSDGTVHVDRLSGIYNIGISGKADTAGQADYATNVNGGTVTATTGAFSGNLTVDGTSKVNGNVVLSGNNTDRNIIFDGSPASGNSKWRLSHTASGSGEANYFRLQTTGSDGSSYGDVVRFGMNTKDAVFSGTILPAANGASDIGSPSYRFGNIYADDINGTLTGNASSATRLATARSIALSSGATGSATLFDGTKNIIIPVTALNAAKLNAGTVPTARLAGTYGIGISGNAGSATRLAAARSINGVAFDGTSNITVADATKLATAGGTMTGAILLPSIKGQWITGLTGQVPLDHDASAYQGVYYPVLRHRQRDSTFNIGGTEGQFGIYRFDNSRTENGRDSWLVMTADGNVNASGSVTAPSFIGSVSGNADSATRLESVRTISLGTGAAGTPVGFNGTADIVIPVTGLNAGYLNSGTVSAGRLAGTYNIGISGRAATAGAADTAVNAQTAVNVDGGNVNATEGKFSQSVQAANFYSPEGMYNAYLGGERGRGVTAGYSGGNYGGIGYNIQHTGTMGLYKAPLYDTASYIRFTAGGFEFLGAPSGAAGRTLTLSRLANIGPSGDATFSGSVTAPTFSGILAGNAATATKLAMTRTISLGTGVTGTPTAFDGTSNIVVPVTEMNAAYLLRGVLPAARLTGTYDIGISGKAATAGAADTAASAASATKLATARSLNVTGAATGTAATFDGTGNANIAVTQLDPTKLSVVESSSVVTRYDAASYYNRSSSTSGAFKITLPDGTADAMISIELDILNYSGGHHNSKVIIGGYTSNTTKSWHIPTASVSIVGDYSYGVRLGYDGSNFCIILGSTVSSWSFPTIKISRVTASNYSRETFSEGSWDISMISDESGITNIITPPSISAQSATRLATARTIAIGTGGTGTPTLFNGTADIVIPLTAINANYISSGTVGTSRLSGTYNIGISGKAATAGAADTAAQATNATTATNVSGGSVNATTGRFTGDLTVKGDNVDRNLVFDGTDTDMGKWRLSHSASGGGDANYFRLQTTGSGGTVYADVLRFGMDTKDAVFSGNILPAVNNSQNIGSDANKFENVYATNFSGSLTGNATTATQLAVARTIALGTAVTGTPTPFSGAVNITIPVTALNAGYLSAGTIPTARLTGTYGIDISGTARYAQELSSPISSVAYADTAGYAAAVGDFTNTLYAERGSEINFGGTSGSDTIYFGYRARDSKPMPNIYIFGTGSGTATVQAKTFVGSLTGNASSATTVTTPSGTYKHLGAWGVGRTDAGAILVNTAYRADIATTAQSLSGGIPGGMVPNYSGRRGYGKDVTHTAPSDGYIMVSFGYGTLQIAGVTLINSSYVDFCSKHTHDVYVFPIKSGDTFRVSGGNLYYLYFVPKS